MPFSGNERRLLRRGLDTNIGTRFNQLKAAFLQGSFQIDGGCGLRLRCRYVRLRALLFRSMHVRRLHALRLWCRHGCLCAGKLGRLLGGSACGGLQVQGALNRRSRCLLAGSRD